MNYMVIFYDLLCFSELSLYATSLGKNGVPATFKDLLKDMNEAKRMWTQLAKNLKKLK